MKDHNNPEFKSLLKRLQEESWQLELLISGFAIFGLFSAWKPLTIAIKEATNNEHFYSSNIYAVLLTSISILLFNLLLHVILRGLWIGALGLRYVSGEIDFDSLNYSPKFTKYLKKRIGSFDKYISTLENYCSIIFAISFLMVFYFLAFFLSALLLAIISKYILLNESLSDITRKAVGIPVFIITILCMILLLIDFFTQGFLKKKKWLSKIYFPIYLVFSIITLSFLYRPLIYNFLDNKFGKRISYILIPLYIVILILTTLKVRASNYFEKDNHSSEYVANNENYQDMLIEKENFIKSVAIPSKIIKDSYLNIFFTYSNAVEDRIFKRNKGLKPEKDKRGLYSDIVIVSDKSKEDIQKKDSLKQEYIKTFNNTYKVYIDSTQYKSDFIIGTSKTNQFGFESNISINHLQNGRHTLRIKRDEYSEKDTTEVIIRTIPFWYYKE